MGSEASTHLKPTSTALFRTESYYRELKGGFGPGKRVVTQERLLVGSTIDPDADRHRDVRTRAG